MLKLLIKSLAVSLLLGFYLATGAFAQEPKDDLEILQGSICSGCDHSHHQVTFLQPRSESWVARYNPVSLTFSGLMYVYQRFISPQLPSECLYETSCSHFSKDLISEYGLLKGVFTTADRLMRCNRVAAIDVHPLLIDEQTGKIKEPVEIYKFPRE